VYFYYLHLLVADVYLYYGGGFTLLTSPPPLRAAKSQECDDWARRTQDLQAELMELAKSYNQSLQVPTQNKLVLGLLITTLLSVRALGKSETWTEIGAFFFETFFF